jgi:hydroxymethylglutaryl-CoA lyase
MTDTIKLIECPRDAMQGLHDFIPTALKAHYINLLLEIGFDTIDFGSFVSPKAIPQMRDTAEVLNKLSLITTQSKLLAIIANTRGATDACEFEEINYLGFPLSVSETFQERNTNQSIQAGLKVVEEVQNLCEKHKKEQVVYLSMGFGNPYEDAYSPEIVEMYAEKLQQLGINTIALSDTIGISNPNNIKTLFESLVQRFSNIEWGVHLHSTPQTAVEKIKAAYEAGCRRFDGAIRGFGGCPMAKDDLTGNIATEIMMDFFDSQKIDLQLDRQKFSQSYDYSNVIFKS